MQPYGARTALLRHVELALVVLVVAVLTLPLMTQLRRTTTHGLACASTAYTSASGCVEK